MPSGKLVTARIHEQERYCRDHWAGDLKYRLSFKASKAQIRKPKARARPPQKSSLYMFAAVGSQCWLEPAGRLWFCVKVCCKVLFRCSAGYIRARVRYRLNNQSDKELWFSRPTVISIPKIIKMFSGIIYRSRGYRFIQCFQKNVNEGEFDKAIVFRESGPEIRNISLFQGCHW